jgi:DUF4097 and DUF4098 domain-containing protein YvlB
MNHRHSVCALIGVLVLLSGCNVSDSGDGMKKINGSVHVHAGQPPAVAETVNGGIDIEAGAAVTVASTVNGGIQLGDHATADKLTTVNGGILIGSGAHVAGTATSVNGSVLLKDGADVLGKVANVNGKISLTTAHVGGGIKTVSGDIKIYGTSHVEGGITIEKSSGIIKFGNDTPRVEIGPGATVQGDLHFEREVKLYVSDRATIGTVSGATPIAFSGDTAPAG